MKNKHQGYIKRNRTVEANERHGLRQAPEYENWHNMKQRCLNPNYPKYIDYGGRGISIHDEWVKSFTSFYEDMGQRPTQQHSLDRIDNHGDYTPENCRWATKTEQIVNRRLKKPASGYNGVTKNRSKWACKVWVNYKPIGFGSYEERIEAAYIYDQVIMQLHGKHAKTNFDWE